jgi:hypothetical protein
MAAGLAVGMKSEPMRARGIVSEMPMVTTGGKHGIRASGEQERERGSNVRGI